ncbi:MAG: TlpA family protein disulfide reductase [Bacteroidales bacterium]|nr:TlpA family protein disulfide reductase [Bacteroidales bacterium]MCF8456854.1 TlpA family protein disulfide reductase [Bacteroidales bacterium]
MMKLLYTLLTLFLYLNSLGQIKEYNFQEFEPLLHKQTDSIYVVNFWATWCSPCVAELPSFEKLNQNFKNQKVKVLLVSLDFPKHKESRLIPFVKKNNLQSEVIFLNDVNANAWINKVDPNWSGAIPFTVIYNAEQRKYYERSFNYEELIKETYLFLTHRTKQ